MTHLGAAWARLSPKLAHRPGAAAVTGAHARLLRASRGRLGRRLFGAEVMVLRTTGRRSGRARENPVFFVDHGSGWAIVASNAASERPPAWLANLDADPAAAVLVRGRTHRVRGRRASPAEAAELWPRFVETYRGYDHYRSIARRDLPVVVLEPA